MPVTRRINVDLPLVLVASALTIYGLAVVFSAGQTDVKTVAQGAYRLQAIWTCIGILGAFAVSRASVRLIEWMTLPAYGLTIVLLVALLAGFGSGAGTAQNTSGWLTIGGHRLGQPAELAKLTVVLMLARVLSQNRIAPKSMAEMWKPLAVAGVPLLLIMLQGDLGTSIVFVGIFFAMLFWAGVEWQLLVLLASPVISLILGFDSRIWGGWFLTVVAIVLWYKPFLVEALAIIAANVLMGIVGPLLWEHLKPYRQNRLRVFLDPSVDPRGSGYHVIQSRVAIGSGGWFGRGYLHGPQKRLAFLPEQYTDFIFAVVGEELGFIGVMVALALFLFLFLRVIRISERANDSFSSLVAFGLLASWFTHALENIGMTLGLMPITGIPLPFFSYGGSFMLACWLSVGVLARISSEGRGGMVGALKV
ncbi:MAG TPA: rod shape-determining protein RodA [Gemmatimonadaceae bacterium]|jgi:rod shape determining protein RodA|nr:rod shape-determining protein RodA [Gemmatimonadaceae bacterium]